MTTGPDIILGVSRAVDAVKQRQAAARLERLSQELAGTVNASGRLPEDWPADVRPAEFRPATVRPAEVGEAAAGSQDAAPATKVLARSSAPGPSDASKEKSEAYVQFEAVLLQNMIEVMMPKETEALMGKGTAGQIWKSMLSEKIAAEIARSGTLGIAKQVAAGVAEASRATLPSRAKVDPS